MIKLFIQSCSDLPDPLTDPDIMVGLGVERREKILRLKHASDRKRSLMAGLMIRDNLKAYGINPDEIRTSDNGRPFICDNDGITEVPGIDFNISHSGDYVVMGIYDMRGSNGSVARIGCDIEQIRDRNTKIAKRYFDEAELEWIEQEEDKIRAFYQIWTARESYIKMTGEGILLDFKSYRVKTTTPKVVGDNIQRQDDVQRQDGIQLVSDTASTTPLGVSTIYRDGKKEDYIINQWLLDDNYIISICSRTKYYE